MKTKKKSLLLSFVLCLLLALSTLITVPFRKADAEVKVEDFATGGTVCEITSPTASGTVSYATQTVTGGKESSYSGAMYVTNSGVDVLNLGTIDITGITAEKPLISFLPYFSVADTESAPINLFRIHFTSGEKKVTVGNFVRKSSYNMGLVAGANGQSLRGWNWHTKAEDAGAENYLNDTACENFPFTLGGRRSNRSDNFFYADGTSGKASAALIEPINVYFGENSSGQYTIYTDTTMRVEDNKETFSFGSRYRLANLEGYSSAPWTPFTEDEMKNVTVTVEYTGVKGEMKMLFTTLNGKAIGESDVANYNISVPTLYGINTNQGIARTLTYADNTITVANKMVLGDNDVFTPLATVALFPNSPKTGLSVSAVASGSYYSRTVTDWPKLDEPGQYWKTATSESEYNAAIANWESKFASDIDALYLNFASASGKEMSVKLAYRSANDANGQTSFRVKTSAQTDDKYYGAMITNGSLNTSNATSAVNGVRFDGLKTVKYYDEKGNAIASGGYTDPIYNIYYDAKTNSLYTDTGIMSSNYIAPTNFGTEQDPVYRWLILDLDGTMLAPFEGFGEEQVSMSLSVDMRDKDADGDLTDENAKVMIMSLDGQALANDGTNITSPALAPNSSYGYDEVVYAQVGKNHAGQTIKTNSVLEGEKEYDYTQYDMEVTGPDGAVAAIDGRFAMAKSGVYEVTIKIAGDKVGSYIVKAGASRTADEIISKFDKIGETDQYKITDISYGALPSYMNFDGVGINVTQTNIYSPGGADVTREPSAWFGMDYTTPDVKMGVSVDGVDLNDSSSIIKVAFPGVNEAWGKNNGAYYHTLKITDPVSGRWISLFLITCDPNSTTVLVKAIASWEVMGFGNLIREAGYDKAGKIATAATTIDANSDGTVTYAEATSFNWDNAGWSAGTKAMTGVYLNANAGAPIEIKFENDGKLYFVYEGTETLIRDFSATTAAYVELGEGEAYPSGNTPGAKLVGNFAENGIVDIDFGIGANNKRNKDSEGKHALEHRYTIMSVNGVDFIANNDAIIDSSKVREVAYAGEEVMIADEQEHALTFVETRLFGTFEVQTGKIQVEDILSEREYLNYGNLFYPAVDYRGERTVTYTGETGVTTATVRIVPVLTATAGYCGTIKVDGEVPTEYDATGSYEITVEPNAHYEVDTFTVGGVDKKAELVDGAYAYDGTGASGNVAIKVTFRAITYTITYDLAGGTVEHTNPVSYSVEIADITLVAPTSAVKTGHTFAGWSVETIDTSVGGNVTVTATWAKISYVVTFETNGGGPIIASGAEYDTLVSKPADPTKDGFAFAGWYADEALTTAWDFANDKVTAPVTIYAKWLNVYTVSFTDGVAVQNVVVGEKATEPTEPTKTGYTFAGWFVGTTEYDFETEVTAPVVLTAKWTINTYTVTFNANGGSAVANATVNYDTAVTAPTAPTKAGYEFAGWYADEALTTAWNFTEGKITADTTLYAKWTEVVVTPPADDTTPDDTTPEDTTPDDKPAKKKGCGKEAAGLLAVVLSALAVVFVSKRK